jgi:hypothetical protein
MYASYSVVYESAGTMPLRDLTTIRASPSGA